MQKNKTKSSNKGSFPFEKGGSLNDKNFQIKHNLKVIISEKDTVSMFNKSFLYPNEVLNNSHIYVKWADYLFFKSKKNYCPKKKCADCPTFGYTNKREFLDSRFDKRWYILLNIPPKNLKETFEKFIFELISDPKSTGTKRAISSINTYISQIKKWEKNVNDIMKTKFNITIDVKNKIKIIVINADDLIFDSEKTIKNLCKKLKIEFTNNMLQWPKGKRQTDGIWGEVWYKKVINSTTFNSDYINKEIKIPSKYNSLLKPSIAHSISNGHHFPYKSE